mmetsp:Transcript_145051/g.252979  ORF Transcript_145051/g.252979 Transcript_145051/m.252979 type:complete len:468 (+) Transcript_145051:1179-2582(+)
MHRRWFAEPEPEELHPDLLPGDGILRLSVQPMHIEEGGRIVDAHPNNVAIADAGVRAGVGHAVVPDGLGESAAVGLHHPHPALHVEAAGRGADALVDADHQQHARVDGGVQWRGHGGPCVDTNGGRGGPPDGDPTADGVLLTVGVVGCVVHHFDLQRRRVNLEIRWQDEFHDVRGTKSLGCEGGHKDAAGLVGTAVQQVDSHVGERGLLVRDPDEGARDDPAQPLGGCGDGDVVVQGSRLEPGLCDGSRAFRHVHELESDNGQVVVHNRIADLAARDAPCNQLQGCTEPLPSEVVQLTIERHSEVVAEAGLLAVHFVVIVWVGRRHIVHHVEGQRVHPSAHEVGRGAVQQRALDALHKVGVDGDLNSAVVRPVQLERDGLVPDGHFVVAGAEGQPGCAILHDVDPGSGACTGGSDVVVEGDADRIPLVDERPRGWGPACREDFPKAGVPGHDLELPHGLRGCDCAAA